MTARTEIPAEQSQAQEAPNVSTQPTPSGMDLHHILPQIDVTNDSHHDINNSSINNAWTAYSPNRLTVPDLTPYPSPVTSPSSSRAPSPHNEQWWSGKYDFAAKIIILGDYGVGKTTLLSTLGAVKDLSWCRCVSFRPNEFVEMECMKNDKKILIRIMDTGGQERFRSMTSSYFRGAHGCLLTFSVTNEDSFNNVINWFNDVSTYAPPDNFNSITSLVVGTVTSTTGDSNRISAERAYRLADSLNLTYCETHVRDQQMVLWILTRLVNNVIVSRVRRQSLAITIMPSKLLEQKASSKRRKCCKTS